MIGFISYASLGLTVATALVLPRLPEPGPPSGWNVDLLEPYDVYHTRYLAVGCQNQHNTAFFDECCHPLLATETLEEARPDQCIPNSSDPPPDPSTDSDPEPTTHDDSPVDDSDEEGPSPSDPIILSTEHGPQDDGEHDDGAPHEDGAPSDDGTPEGDAPHDQGAPSDDGTPEGDAPHDQGAPSDDGTPEGDAPHNQGAPSDGGETQPPSGDAPPPSDGGSGDLITGGFATFYEQEGTAGACGDFHSDDDLIGALDFRRYGDVDAASEHCGKRIRITNTNNGNSVEVVVADACPTCENENCVDLSHGAFSQLATFEEGMVPIEWSFV